jgi:hypothetical protein
MGGKTSTSTQSVSVPPEVLDRYRSVNERAETTAQRGFQSYSSSPDAFAAPLTSTQRSGIQNTNYYSGVAKPYYDTATDVSVGANSDAMSRYDSAERMLGQGLGDASGYYHDATNYARAGGQTVDPSQLDIGRYMSPFIKSVVQPTYEALNQQQQAEASGQIGNAIRSGAFGGDRSGIAAANLGRQQTLAMSQAINPLYQAAYDKALETAMQQQGVGLSAAQANRAATQQTADRLANIGSQRFNTVSQGAQQTGALGTARAQTGTQAAQTLASLGTGAQTAGLQGAAAQLQAGQQEQQTEQAGKSALYNQFLQEQGYPFQVAQFLANIAMGTGSLSGSTTTTTQPSSFFSDRKMKKDIDKVGKTKGGLEVYTYKYKDDPEGKTHIGLMADDVEKKVPEAVGLAGAFKTVDYDKALNSRKRRASGGLADFVPTSRSILGGSVGLSRIPAEVLAAGNTPRQLMLPKVDIQKPKGMMEEIATATKNAETLGNLWDKGSSLYDKAKGYFSSDDKEKREGLAAGGLPYADETDTPLEGVVQDGQNQKYSLKTADSKLSPPRSTMDDVKDIAKLAMLFFNKGGRVGYATGGVPIEDLPAEGAIEALYSPEERDLIARTVVRESSGDPEESKGIAAVINNRVKSGKYGPSVVEVLTAKNQFEPWSLPASHKNHPLNVDPNSPKYKMALGAVDAVDAGEDPTGGKTHFYAPKAQAGLGRAAPSWDDGSGLDIGETRFLKPEEGADKGLGSASPKRKISSPPGLLEGLKGMLPEKKDTQGNSTGETNWKQVIIPVLTGLGAMASSPSRYAGSAILQGLGAGAQSYANLEKQQAEVERTLAGTETQKTITAANLQDVSQKSIFTKGGYDFVQLEGSNEPMLVGEWMSLPPDKRPMPRGGPQAAAAIIAAYSMKGAKSQTEGLPKSVPTSPALEAPKAPEAPEAPTPKYLGQAGKDFSQKDYKELISAPQSFREQQAALSSTKEKEIQDSATAARSQGNSFNQLANQIVALPSEGLIQGGPLNEIKSTVLNRVNDIVRSLKMPPEMQIQPEDLATGVAVNKLAGITTFATAHGNAQNSLGALDVAKDVVPSTRISKDAAAKVIAGMYIDKQRAIDLQNYLDEYKSSTSQNRRGLPNMYRAQNAELAFSKDFSDARYGKDKEALEKILMAKHKGTPLLNKLYKGEVPIEFVEKAFNAPGISRYILNN